MAQTSTHKKLEKIMQEAGKMEIEENKIPDDEKVKIKIEIPESVQELKESNKSSVAQEKIQYLRDVFAKERKFWREKLDYFSEHFKKVESLISLQTEIYSYKQKVTEERYDLIPVKLQMNNSIRYKKGRNYYDLRTGGELKFNNSGDIAMVTEADMRNTLEKFELVTMHIHFLEDVGKNIDHIIWGMQKRIDLENMVNPKY